MSMRIPSFTSGKLLRGLVSDQSGGATLLIVIGAMVVILLVAASVAGSARQEIRMSMAESASARVEAMIIGALNEVARRAQEIPNWPDGDPELTDGLSNCTPPTVSYPSFCRQVLAKRSVTTDSWGDTEQIPIRIVWKPDAQTDAQTSYGWVVVNDAGQVMGVWSYHHWCVPDPLYDPVAPVLGPCKMGS